jgi:hypothetical protein
MRLPVRGMGAEGSMGVAATRRAAAMAEGGAGSTSVVGQSVRGSVRARRG